MDTPFYYGIRGKMHTPFFAMHKTDIPIFAVHYNEVKCTLQLFGHLLFTKNHTQFVRARKK